MVKLDKGSIEEVIETFISEESELHEEIDWWLCDAECDYNVHNYASKDVALFQVDVYPHAEGQGKPDYTTWETVKTFNFNDYKKGE